MTGDPAGDKDDDSDDSTPLVRPDGGRDASTPKGDAGTGKDSGETKVDSGFDECADTKVDGERKAGSVNVVWVIDTSGSMDQEAAQVQQNMNRFAEQIDDVGLEDYRVVVISERDFINVPDPLGSDATRFLHIEQRVDSEEPLSRLLDRFPDYKDFLIGGALTHFIAVTDDESDISAEQWRTQTATNLGNDNFRLNAIASPPGESAVIFGIPIGACTGPYGNASRPGEQYWAAAEATQGLTFSICSGDWSALLEMLAKAVGESASVPCSLNLPDPPQGQVLDYNTVNVLLGDKPLPRANDEAVCGTKAGWFYDNPAEPTTIELCPTSCDAAENGGTLQVALGCTTIVM